MNEWISVKDRLPEVGQWILAFIPHEHQKCIWWDDDLHSKKYCMKIRYSFKSAMTDDPKSRFHGVTHWMLLPEPPEEMKIGTRNIDKFCDHFGVDRDTFKSQRAEKNET